MKNSALNEIFDDTILSKISFVRKDGKLKIVRKKIRKEIPESNKPLFPISKVRK